MLWSIVLSVLLGSALPSLAQTPVSFLPATTFATGAIPASVAISDVNGDGKPDLIAVNTGANTVSVLLGTGDGSFGPKTDFPTGTVPHGVAVADLNGDGKPDIVVANTGADTVSVLLGNGTGSFGAATDFPTGAAPFFVAIGDLNGDGIPDLAVVNVNADTVSVLLGRGDGSFMAKTDFPTGAGARAVAIGDLNGDGVPDLVVANASANTVSVLLGTGSGKFAPKTDFATGAGARAVAIGDVNGDGLLDVVVANANADTVSVLLGTGTGTLGSKNDFATGAGPRAIAISDVNKDGKPDLVVANFTGDTVSVLLGIGNGTFTSKTDLRTGAGPFSIAIADLNGDGRPDLVVGDVNADSLTVFVNSTPATMTSPAPGSTLASAVVPFTWSAGSSGVVQYWLNAGTTPGGWDLYTAAQGASLSRTITGLPTNRRTVYVRLWTQFSGGAWEFNDYTYTAAGLVGAEMRSPAPGSMLSGSSISFIWSAGSGVVQYWLNAGTMLGGWDLYTTSQGTSLSRTITGLPTNGSTVYVRLWTQFSDVAWGFNDYTYTAASPVGAAIASPAPGSLLPGASVAFTWSAGSGVVQYWLNAGTTPGGWDLYTASQGASLSRTITGLPSNGSTVYVRLWTQFSSGAWGFSDYTYTAASLLAGMTSPAMGSVLPGASVTFTWNTGSGAVQYWLNAGTTLGGWDLYTASQGTSPSRTITGLPTNGSTVYVRLWTQSSGGAWGFNDYTFMARP